MQPNDRLSSSRTSMPPVQPSTPSQPVQNPLASLSPEQLAEIFQFMVSLYNSVFAPAPAPNPPVMCHSHRAATLIKRISSLPKLKEGNYGLWAFVAGDAVRSLGLDDHLTGAAICPQDKKSWEYDLYMQEAGAVRATIIGTLDHETSFRYLWGTTTAKEAWDALKRYCQAGDDAALKVVDRQLISLRLEEGGNFVEHIALFKRLKWKLDGSEFEIDSARAVQLLRDSLPPSYDHFVLLQKYAQVQDFESVCIELESHYRTSLSHSGPTYASASCAEPSTRDWNIPPDLRQLRPTGAKNPALAARAKNTCRDCNRENS